MKSGSKIWLEGIYLTQLDDEDEKVSIEAEKNITTKAKKVLSDSDTLELFQDFFQKTVALTQQYKTNVKRL